MRSTCESVVALTDRVYRDYLDQEYHDLARAMAAALCRKQPSPLGSGQPRSWDCGIVPCWASSTSRRTRTSGPA